MTICPLWGPLSSLLPSVSSTALCPLYGLLFPLRPSVPSKSLCPLYGPLYPLENSETSKTILLFREMFCKTRFSNLTAQIPFILMLYFNNIEIFWVFKNLKLITQQLFPKSFFS